MRIDHKEESGRSNPRRGGGHFRGRGRGVNGRGWRPYEDNFNQRGDNSSRGRGRGIQNQGTINQASNAIVVESLDIMLLNAKLQRTIELKRSPTMLKKGIKKKICY